MYKTLIFFILSFFLIFISCGAQDLLDFSNGTFNSSFGDDFVPPNYEFFNSVPEEPIIIIQDIPENNENETETESQLMRLLSNGIDILTNSDVEDAIFQMGGNEDGFIALDFEDIPALMKATLDENGIYQITYIIPEDMEAEIIRLDLAKVSEEISALQGMMESDVLQPGDVRVMNVWIKSESGHTYKYQDGSFILQTPYQNPENVPLDPEYQVIGFDGQLLEENYVGTNWMEVSYMVPPILEYYRAAGISEYDIEHNLISSYDSNIAHRKIIVDYGNGSNDLSTAIENMLVAYYSEKEGIQYSDLNELLNNSETAYDEIRVTSMVYQGRPVRNVYLTQGREQDYNVFYQDSFRWVYGEEMVMAATDNLEVNRFQYSTYEVYDTIDYDDNTIHYNCVPLNSLSTYYQNRIKNIFINAGIPREQIPDDLLVEMTIYGYSFGFVDEEGNFQTASNNEGKTLVTQQREYGSDIEYSAWSLQDELNIKDTAVGDYMFDKLNQDGDGAWHKANEYFKNLLSNGITGSPEEAAWLSFLMATNIDFYRSSNNHQDTSWGWENEIRLERVDGNIEITKTGQTIIYDIYGNIDKIIESPVLAEAETSFSIWKYDNDGNKIFLTQTQDADGNLNNGYVWSNDTSIDYVIDTTNGKLNIDTVLLEGQIYYLQEAIAPSNYKRDMTIYIICNDEDMEKATQMLNIPGGEYSHELNGIKLNIDSLKTLQVKLLNVKEIYIEIPDVPDIPDEPEPPEPPTPPEPPVIPEPPDIPEPEPNIPETPSGRNLSRILEINDYRIPLAGLINMNEGDCFD